MTDGRRGADEKSSPATELDRPAAETLVDVARIWAHDRPERVLFRLLGDGETESACLTFGELDRRARAVAALLRERGAQGERALLLYPSGLELVVAFLGCLYSGTVAVPAYPPRTHRSDPRLRAVAEDAKPRFALASASLCERAAELGAEIPALAGVSWLTTEGVDPAVGDPWTPEEAGKPAPEDLAFLQYTSGSTSTPKGVMVRHGNLLHNQQMIQAAFGQSEDSVIVGWLPLHHDMGLIGNVLQPLYVGARCVLMPPVAFLQRPARWLEAISRYRATTSGGPSFAYELCAQRLGDEDLEGLDLSSWAVAFNGAEPVRAETLERFARAFAGAGFRQEAFFPCYGLAEATLFVSGPGAKRPPVVRTMDAEALARDRAVAAEENVPARKLVGCGRVWGGQTVAIVDPESGRPLDERQVGEILVRGPSVAGGYWNRPEETAQTFGADGAEEVSLRTGDLGFLDGDELFVTGRLKDLIIVRGRNLYPQDVELTAENSHPGLRSGCGAAFSVEADGEERLVVVQEVERTWRRRLEGVAEAVVRAVAEEHQVPVHAVALVLPGAVPKTTSGKIQRRACRAAFAEGRFEILSEWRSGDGAAAPVGDGSRAGGGLRSPTEERLAELWAEVFELDTVDREDDFFLLGGDSLQATRLVGRIEREFGIDLPLDALFDAPSVAGLAAVVERMDGPAAERGIPPLQAARGAVAERPAPLSFTQRRLWFLHRLAPDNPVHNIAGEVELVGALDARALERSFASILDRHEALRTGFSAVDEGAVREPVQALRPAPPQVLPRVDLSALPEPTRLRQSATLAKTLARCSFDLEHGPFVRTVLFRETETAHRLVVVMHHIAGDGASLELFVRETAGFYEAFVAGEKPRLPELPVQYSDYARWQRRWLRGEALEERLAYWRERLSGLPVATELPTDRPRPPVLSHRGAHHERLLRPDLAEALEALGRREGATPFMVLLAGFLALVQRSTGTEDLVVGTPISGRIRPEIENLIGVFINNLVLRVDASGAPGFRGLLGRVRAVTLGAFAHQELPFETLVDDLAPQRDLSRTPLFQLMFVGQNAPLRRLRVGGLELVPREVDAGTARFDLSLSMAPTDEGWLGTWKHSRDLFDLVTIARMAEHLEVLLRAVVTAPERPISALPLMAPSERHQVVRGWNDTARPYRSDVCLHELIAEQAERTPEAVAVTCRGEALTYRELIARAGKVADRLRSLGVGPEGRVGIAADRSLGLVVGLVGILQSGAAYVPLDPAYPRDRLAFMLRDSAVAALIVQPHLEDRVQRGEVPVLRLDAAGVPVGRGGEGAPERSGALPVDAAAYAIYTSGSTGQPKGAVISHRAIVNRLLWMQEAYGLGSEDRVLQKTPFSFDVSVWELFWPLITGAILEVAPPGVHQDATLLAELIRDARVTTLHFVPSMLQLFLEEPDLERSCVSVRRVITSGEALPYGLKERCLARVDAALHNLYGPTEAAVDVTAWPCARGGDESVPIGRPIGNLRIHILDRNLRVAPVSIPGELLIGGVGLARGYLGRPGLTAERFVPDPLAGQSPGSAPGGRLYRTGDLARHRPDGRIEFLGRLDHQVKVRGFRIELGEIEAALSGHPAVREAVVVARADLPGDRRLVAYVVGVEGSLSDVTELRRFLGTSLPEHMVPSAFVFLEALPLTPSGKVDRRSLPAPAHERPELETSYAAPRTDLERLLADLWAQRLDVERIGVDDDFFALGGDSIQGAMLVNRLQRELGEIVYVMALFDAPTVRRLAAHLEEAYPRAVARLAGRAPSERPSEDRGAVEGSEGLVALRAAVARRLRRPRVEPPGPGPLPEPKLAPAVFLLSPFRSGSTLLRVMLAGHSRLFAPPELELLGFDTMGERRLMYAGRDSFALEGLLRAVMELGSCDARRAREIVGRYERQDLPTRRFYGQLQGWIGDRLLVDKTPSYSLDAKTLQRAEEVFDGARYIHLVRHPLATVRSYVESRMDRVYHQFPYGPREQGELVWRLGHENIVEFLGRVPEERWVRVRFEELVRDPRATMESLSALLGLEMEEAMLHPYRGERMTDGLHAASRMMGDPKFHQHRGIDAAAAERWRETGAEAPLARASRELAAALGYPIMGEAAADGEPAAAIRPELAPAVVADGAEAPLSFAQERLWFISQLEPASAAYNMPAAVRLEGELDVRALGAAFAEVLRRHEVLRTSFPSEDGGPVPRIAPPGSVELPLVDLGHLSRELGQEPARSQAEALAADEGRRSFDLFAPGGGAMLRGALVRLAPREHLLLVTMHHIASDGWSIGVLIRELAALYEAFSQGDESPLAPLPIQYADYARWQRRWLGGELLEGHLGFWRERLEGPLPVLELPTDRPRPPVQTFNGDRRSLRLSRRQSTELREWSRSRGATLFLTLLAGFNALLVRHTGQDDVLLGIPVANRNRVEVEGLIGFFLNMVVQRTDAAGTPTFDELLARASDRFLDSTPHHEVPFEKVVEAVQPARDLSRSPIFQIQFSLQNTPMAPLELPGLTLSLLELHNRTTKFDLTVFLFDEDEGLRTTLEYNSDLFDATTIERFLGHWRTLLEGALADPGLRLPELPLLTAAERAQIETEWNAPRASFPADEPLHRLFEARSAEYPDAPAVIYEVEELSYRRLDRRANRLAHHLRRLGVGPEVPVGLCLERSIDMVVGVLGILKAGGAYVPLDPAYPSERLAFMVDDALGGVPQPVVVTRRGLAEGLAAGGAVQGLRQVLLDADRQALEAEDDGPPDVTVPPTALAYVIYTSGSTGRPKGVQVTHANAVRLLRATEAWFDFGPDDVWTLFHSYAFDFSVWEIWGALAYGGRLVVVPQEVTRAPDAFLELVATEGVTVLNQTPSAFRQLVRADAEAAESGLDRETSLRWVVFGGEALDLGALAPWFERHGDSRPCLANMYGITETTVHVTWRRVRAADLELPGSSPVGVPIPDLAVHLAGPRLEPVPIGVGGEILVGGAGVARGYLARPGLTAERFVPDPFAASPGARLYRSGDLARRRPDGDLDYLGRIDHQVKIRGFRIELGEIEAALTVHPDVGEAAVVVIEGASSDDLRLAAYWVSRAGESAAAPAIDALRGHLRERLPEYMVPAHFVALDALPLTPTGKLDRRALPAPDAVRDDASAASVAPRTATERRLAAAWRDVLGLERVGIHDDFFDLGGHSLLATQLISRARAAFGVELPMAAVFEEPTIAGLAERVDRMGGRPDGAPPPVEPVARDGALPLSFAQERLWFLDQLDPGSPLYNVPSAFRMSGRLSVGAFARCLAEVVRRHEALRTWFRSSGGTPVQEVVEGARLRLPVVDLSGLPAEGRGRQLDRLARREAATPFDLERAPLFRARLLRLAGDEHVVLATLHHIVSDGWSVGVLIREVVALYGAFVEGRSSPLPELSVQYADFAAWQRRWLGDEVLEDGVEHWREALDGAPTSLDLPTDRPRPAVQGFRGRHLNVGIPGPLVDDLRHLAREQGATLFMVLLALFQTLLARISGQTDLLVGSPVANRVREEVEPLIGFFVNTLVLRGDLRGGPSLRELVGRVREATLAAYAHQDVPFERLVEELEPERDTSRSPLFQVLFVLQNAPAEALDLPGLVFEPLAVETGTSKFDLTLSMVEDPALGGSGGGLGGFLELCTELFDPATGERFLGHYRNLLEAAVETPDRSVAALPLLTPGERAQLVADWTTPALTTAPPASPSIHRLVAERAAETPDAVAVASSEDRLTYGELHRCSVRLARRLRALGVGVETRVAVALDRSPLMPVALLGVLGSGGAYLPLDPSHPPERLAMILEDAAPALLLADERSETLLGDLLGGPAGIRIPVLRVDRQEDGDSAPDALSEVPDEPDRLAYVIFTSGSTGRPKGVQVSHGALSNFLRSMVAAPGLAAADSLLAVTTLSFDIAGLELFGPLGVGGQVVLASDEDAADGVRLASLLERSRATIQQATPATWRLLLDAGWTGAPHLKALCGGEALPRTLADRLAERVASLWNLYGPTETTVWSARRPVAGGEGVSRGSTGATTVPIGEPIDATGLAVLDPRVEPVPVGVPGELWIGGAGLARGYLGAPALTAERFVPDPFSERPGARLYGTGDLARRLPDGDLEFLGRLDHQVKVRGFRIEPGEIEAALASHSGVAQAVVLARGEGVDRRLVAYLVQKGGEGGEAPTPTALREHLRGRLPDYMVPGAYALLDAFPLTPSGKVDRRALARIEPERPGASGIRVAGGAPFVAPRDPVEELIAGIWQGLLGAERVGVHDNFFELGGHSLLATRLVSRLREDLGVELPVRRLFDGPTVAHLAAAVRDLRRAGEAAGVAALPPIVPVPRDDDAPLSHSQLRQWVLDRLEPGSSAYDIHEAVRLLGPLDLAALFGALDRVVERHEALRTTFPVVAGRPAQRIAPSLSMVWPLVDLSVLEPAAGEAETLRLAAADAGHSFDLSRGPLFKATVVRRAPAEHLLLVNMHHIVSDDWSVGVLIGELAALYRARVAGRPEELPALPVQYADYAAWQQSEAFDAAIEADLEYWRGRLGEGVPPLELPTDRPRPAEQSFRGAEVPVALGAELTRAVGELAAGHGASPFMVLLAAFQALLGRWSGQGDLAVGTFVANRTREAIEPLIGFFVNTLVLTGRPAPERTFGELLSDARETALGAYAHQDLPFERLIEEVQPERTRSRTPLFQVMLVLLNNPRPEVELPGLELETVHVGTRRSNFDLTLWLWPGEDGLEGALHYATDLFRRATARRLVDGLRALLAAAVSDPGRTVAELPILSPAEHHQVLVAWTDGGPVPAPWMGEPSAPFESVATRIAAVAAARPDAVAVVCNGDVLSYGGLLARADRLARRLRGLGVGPEVKVGLAMERSPELIVALLGVLRAGGAYVPVDPAYPAERLALVLSDARIEVLVTERRLDGVVADVGARRVFVDDPDGGPAALAEASAQTSREIPGESPAESLAYVIYTSGSTGRPKGVLVPQNRLAAYTATAVAQYGIAPEDRVLQFASVSFDASVEEIFPALVTGATLVLRTESMIATPARFLERSAAWGVSVLDLPTAYWHQLTAALVAGEAELPPGVRLVILGGEKARAERWADWHRVVGVGARLVNSYGPTEGTVVATLAELGAPEPEPAAPAGVREAPIGRPVAGVRTYVLDPWGVPQPPGVPGELHLGEAGVVRGYLGDPASTAGRFVPDPFSGTAGARLYRTGDLVRWLPDGQLEFVGRVDQQVKVRGFRVEPGEIEAVLVEHPAVAAAVVVASRDRAESVRLVGYVVPAVPAGADGAGEGSFDPSALRASLRDRLPDYMVPAVLVPIDALPLTPSGKLDRRRLPEADQAVAEAGAGYVAPRTPTQELLAEIWAEILGRERIGLEDDFFDLGGHSLLATQIVARVEDAFGVSLPLRAFFDAPSVEELAEVVDRADDQELPPLVPIPRTSAVQDLPVSFSQERIWFLAQLDPTSTAYHVPRALRISGRFQPAGLARAYRALFDRHEVLRATFPEVAGRPVQRVHPPGGTVPLPVIDLSALPDGPREVELARLVRADGARLFDLEHGPLLRASLALLAPTEHVVIQTEHHLVHDGWAEAVILGDLLELYGAFTEGRRPDLPELPIQYADFAAWQRGWLSGEVLDEQIEFWRSHLRGAPPVLELPSDRPRPAVLSSRGDARNFPLPARLTRAIAALGRREGTTLFMASLALFEALLVRLAGREDLVVGSGIANRRRRETEGMLGMIINTLALRTDLSGDPPVDETLHRVRDACLGAYAHQDLPFDHVVEAIRPERSLSHAPVFQVVFAFHDARFPEVDLPGLDVRPAGLHNRSSKFDLVLISTPLPEEGAPAGMEPGGLLVHAEYSTDLFDDTTIARWIGHLETLAEAAVERPDARLSELPLLSRTERWQLTGEWAVGPAAEPVGFELEAGSTAPLAAPDLFRAVAARVPDAIALELADRALSYGELGRRAEALAAELRGAGVGPESIVALFLDRSLEMVVALLGVLETGAAYLPVDPSYPEDRITYLIEDSSAAVVLTAGEPAERLPGMVGEGLQIIRLDDPTRSSATGPAAPRSPGRSAAIDPLQSAYVIYTSGSTGRPKGVAVTHRGLSNLTRAQHGVLGLAPGHRVLQFSALSFDASVWEIVLSLTAGATLVLASRDALMPGDGLGDLLADRRVTTLTLPPSALAVLPERELPALETLVVAGEACTPELVARWAPGRRFVNAYGPTESTICASAARITGEHDRTPVGRPLRGVRTYVVDPRGAPCPTGVAGELLVGGAGVARGYLGRPGLTAERFVPDPFSARSSIGGDGDALAGERAYRTGDLARWLPGGELEFLGRIDQQVKVRGFRIEPAEVEAALRQEDGVGEAVVVARGSGADARLVAYVAPKAAMGGPVRLAKDALRRSLSARLPEHLVPSVLVVLAELPRTPAGKIDRRSLPVPDLDRSAPGRAFVAPRDPTEEMIAALWREVLEVERVGVHDDFFDLGGHSLLATRLLARLRRAAGAALPVRELFDAPTVAGLAEAVRRARLRGSRPEAPPLEPVARSGELPLSYSQQRVWFVEQLEGQSLYGLPVAVRLDGALDPTALAASLAEIVRRHEALRTRFPATGGRPVQVIDPPPSPPSLLLPVVDLSAIGAEDGAAPPVRSREVARLAARDARRPFDLARGPLVRATLVRLAADRHVALVSMHHIVSDGWSMGVFLRELAALYGALLRGEPSPLPELPVQYADYAAWQRAWLDGPVLEAEQAYWAERLAGLEPLELPTDRRPRESAPVRAGDVRFRLPEPLAARIVRHSQERGSSLFMTLLAGLQTLLHRHTGATDVAVGSPVAGRGREEIEGLIGFFVNTLILRSDLSGEPSFETLGEQVRETVLAAYDHQDLPYDKVVESLRPARDARGARRAAAQVEVMFSLHNQPMPEMELPGLALSPLDSNEEGLDLRTEHALAVRLWQRDGTLAGAFGYHTGLFDRTTAARWLGHFLNLLAGAVEEPERPIGALSLMSAAERHQVTVEWGSETGASAGARILGPGNEPAPIRIWGRVTELAEDGADRVRWSPFGEVERPEPDSVAGEGEPSAREASAAEPVERRRDELSGRIGGLSEAKRRLLEQRLGRLRGDAAARPVRAPKADGPAGTGSALVRLEPGRAGAGRPPLVLVHPLSGEVFCYRELARSLAAIAPGQPVHALEASASGLENGALDLAEIAERHVETLRRAVPDGPYLLAGWSFGGVVAFEIARQLRAAGSEVPLLALFDSWVPVDDGGAGEADGPDALVDRLPDLPAGLDPARVERTVALYRAQLKALRSYRPGVYPGAVTLFRAEHTEPEALARPSNGWEPFVEGGLELLSVAVSHHEMLSLPGVQELAAKLRPCLERVVTSQQGAVHE